MSILLAEHCFTADYQRGYGMHTFDEMETPVTVISQPDYTQFLHCLSELATSTSGIVLSPELIANAETDGGWTFNPQVIAERITEIQEVSGRLPGCDIVLGASQYDNARRLHNAALYLSEGIVLGSRHKALLTPGERGIFAAAPFLQPELQLGRLSIAICADIIAAGSNVPVENLMTAHTSTLLMPAYWSVPLSYSVPDRDAWYQINLENAVETTFQNHPELAHIVVADRAKTGSDIQPYNAHFQRI